MIDKDDARYFVGVLRGIETRNYSAERVPNENVRPRDSSVFQCGVRFADPECAGVLRTGIAPSYSRVIVRTHLGESGDFRLHESPIEGVPGTNNDNRWASCSGAIEVDSIAADVDQLAKRCC